MAKKKENIEQVTDEMLNELEEVEYVSEPVAEEAPATVDVEAFKARKLRSINLMSNERRRRLHAQWLLAKK